MEQLSKIYDAYLRRRREQKERIYTPLNKAHELLRSRRGLRRTVEAWWRDRGIIVPEIIKQGGDLAALSVPIATRRYYDELFMELARNENFRPIWLTYAQSLMSSESPVKRRLLHPTFVERRGRHGGLVVRKHRIASIEESRGKKLTDIVLNSGESLILYHRRLHGMLGIGHFSVSDLSPLFKQFNSIPKAYYWGYLSLFLTHCVLFDDYHGGEEIRVLPLFTANVFMPVFDAVTKEFGISPIIVRMPWHEHLAYYPPHDNEGWQKHQVIPSYLLRGYDLKVRSRNTTENTQKSLAFA
jgi:hypothetical protein